MTSSGASERSKSPQYNAGEQGAVPSKSSTSYSGNEGPSNRSGNKIDPTRLKVDPNLQSCERNDDGRPTNLILEICERSKADELRARIITHMCENIDDFSKLEAMQLMLIYPGGYDILL